MSDADEPPEPAEGPDVTPAASEALHTTLPVDFEDAVPFVQVKHELVGLETVTVTRLDEMIAGMLGEDVERTALLVTFDILHAPTGAGILALGVSAHAEPPRERRSPTRVGYSGLCAPRWDGERVVTLTIDGRPT